MEKLKSKQMSQLWIDQKELSKFYKFIADKMRALGEEGASATEKQQKLKDNVRTLFGGIFDQSVKADFDGGKEMIKQCEGIISNYITKGASSNWYQKILSSIGETADGYDHASNVATFAAMFGIGTGHKTPEDLAMAGLFHDIGLSQLPQELQSKKESELTAEEKALYYTHIEKSLNMVKAKRIIIPDKVEKAITQHHEHWSGRGFPKQLPAGRISREAQLLCFADQFDHLTCFEEGKQRLSPMQAFEEIKKNGSIDPDLLAAIRPLLAG